MHSSKANHSANNKSEKSSSDVDGAASVDVGFFAVYLLH